MTTPAPLEASHEFAPADAAVFATLGRWVGRTAVLLGVLSALAVALGVEAWWILARSGLAQAFLGVVGLAGFVLAAVLAFTAVQLRRAGGRLAAVDTTAGEDVAHLVAALSGMCLSFRVLQRAALAALALALLVLAAHHGHG